MSYKIKEGCVGCHYCMLECPVGAIRIFNGSYNVDEEKCISCGRCRQVCHLELPYDEEAKEESISCHDMLEYGCDVLVIGAGGVGMGAAARASYLGLDTLVIEAAGRCGGGTYLAHGASFTGSKNVYPRLGLSSDIDGQVGFWNMLAGKEMEDQAQLRKNVAANGEFLDWFDSLDENYCKPFKKGGEHFPFPFDMPKRYLNTKSTDNSIGPGWTGSWIIDKLLEVCKKQNVEILYNTRATQIEVGNDGKVKSVIAEDKGGKIKISAEYFVLATGNYLYDEEALAAIDPDYVKKDRPIFRITVPTNRGDGQKMVKKIGGIVNTDFMRTRGPSHHPYLYAVNMFMGNPENVFFDADGRRLFEMKPGPPPMPGKKDKETPDTPGQKILHSKNSLCYAVMDSAQLESFGKRLLENADSVHDEFAKTWKEDIEKECALEDLPARKADTIRELAEKLGMNPDVLEESVKRYNSFCEKGIDEDFGKAKENMRPIKEAPYYAFIGQNFDNGASLGGVETDAWLRVVKQDGGLFENLFCAGDCATYSPEENKGAVGLCGGLGGSFASGYQIANYIKYGI
ncbi:MAG: FAD-binding protein [Eubacterium sp.]|nr:FAD-binding protein [Eubacterium sp.]